MAVWCKTATPVTVPLVLISLIIWAWEVYCMKGGGKTLEIFHDPAVLSRRLWNLQNRIAHQFNYLPSVCYIRPWATRERDRSFNIMSKVASVTGESIPISSLQRNGSDRSFLDFWQFSFHFGNVRGSCFSPVGPPQSSLRPWRANPCCTLYYPSYVQTSTLVTLHAPALNAQRLDIDPRPVIRTWKHTGAEHLCQPEIKRHSLQSLRWI